MLILACDTSGAQASAALWRDGRIIAEMTRTAGLTHSVVFMPLVDALLSQNSIKPAQIDRYAVTSGPGSFTGIRIGISAVQAMAYATGKPVIGLSTLAVLAWPYRSCPHTLVAPLIDARNNRVYAGAWQDGQAVLPENNVPLADFLAEATSQARSTGCTGLFLIGHPVDLTDWSNPIEADRQLIITQAPSCAAWPRAAALAEMAAGEPISPTAPAYAVQARYLAVPAAERLRVARGDR
jgi:tRNA threonylcarbamoyladenosine biosynthesis protein TsaB